MLWYSWWNEVIRGRSVSARQLKGIKFYAVSESLKLIARNVATSFTSSSCYSSSSSSSTVYGFWLLTHIQATTCNSANMYVYIKKWDSITVTNRSRWREHVQVRLGRYCSAPACWYISARQQHCFLQILILWNSVVYHNMKADCYLSIIFQVTEVKHLWQRLF